MRARVTWVWNDKGQFVTEEITGIVDTVAILRKEKMMLSVPRSEDTLEVDFGKVIDFKHLENYMIVWTTSGVYDVFLYKAFKFMPTSDGNRLKLHDGGKNEEFIN